MKNKKLNKALCSVISVFLATNNLAFATNQSSAQTHSLPQKIVKKVKNNKIAAGTLILGTGLVIAGTIGFILGDDEKIDINEILNSIKNKDEQEVITKIQADEWFERLGGYKNKYIDEYKKKYENFDVKATNTLNDQQNKNYKTIEKDVDRSITYFLPKTRCVESSNWGYGEFKTDKNVTTRNVTTSQKRLLSILEKILKINVCEGTDYAQGFNDIAAMVINKFLRYSDHDYTIEDEAKIYYVYKTILKTVSDKNENSKTDVEKCQDKVSNTPLQIPISEEESINLQNCFILPSLLTCLSNFPLIFSIRVWDSIIEKSNGNFDSDYAFNTISNITVNIVTKFYNFDSKNFSDLLGSRTEKFKDAIYKFVKKDCKI